MIRQRRTIGLLVVVSVLGGLAGLAWLAARRQAACLPMPVLAAELLPNAGLAPDPANPALAAGWGFRTSSGAELQHPSQQKGFDLDGDDRALQLIGIANYVETPPIAVQPGRGYCFAGQALTDQPDKGATRAQLQFRWLDAAGVEVGLDASDWQPVALWQSGAAGWSRLHAAFRAPPGAAQLRVRVRPAADNRLYLDAMHVRSAGGITASPAPAAEAPPAVVLPWPNGASAALSFSFDWETTMGGLIHSRSLAADDPNNAEDPRLRGMRMRQGITTTVELFRAYDIRATYYATGYNFLPGNAERRSFMHNPTFAWAKTGNGWKSDWSRRPWFGSDPYGTIASDPDYYFADLVPLLLAAKHDIQSHTFSHLYGGYASPAEWQADFDAWTQAAAGVGVAPTRSLAFPWSSSGGMSDANWQTLEAAGITSVTRTNRSQSQYQLVSPASPHCAPVPAHASILACPDFYLTTKSAEQARALIDSTVAAGGTIDLWAHTEEVTSPEQIGAWTRVVGHAAELRDAGRLWVAPLAEIADWQTAIAKLKIMSFEFEVRDSQTPMRFLAENESSHDLKGLTLQMPIDIGQYTVNGQQFKTQNSKLITLNLPAGQRVEVQAWPA